MTVERMCELGQVSRTGFYRFDPDREPEDRDIELRDAIQRIALEFPYYGRPRIVPELRRRGWQVVGGQAVDMICQVTRTNQDLVSASWGNEPSADLNRLRERH